jgi:hypothetical protein
MSFELSSKFPVLLTDVRMVSLESELCEVKAGLTGEISIQMTRENTQCNLCVCLSVC